MLPTQGSSQGWKRVEKAETGSGADRSYLDQKFPWVPPDLPGIHHSTLFQIPVTLFPRKGHNARLYICALSAFVHI